jgi:Glycosyl transferase family 90
MLIPLLGRYPYVTYVDGIPRNEYTSSGLHPIEDIVLEGRERFSMLLSRQSPSLDQAMKEYHRRYGRDPPPYFNRWFELAQQHNFALVDEFDVMMQSLEPFWGVPPSTLQILCDNILEQNPQNLLKYEVKNHHVSTSQGSQALWFGDSIGNWLQNEWLELLPDMSLAINVYDEPNVCVPRDALDYAMQLAASRRAHMPLAREVLESYRESSPRLLNLGSQDAWEAVTVSCPLESPARNIHCHDTMAGDAIPFILNITQSKDVCEHCELQSMEGFLFAPETLRLTHSLVPIWSQGKPSSFNDIIFPSPYYHVRAGDYKEEEDKEWDSKNDQLYWVGAATGGHATEGNWKKMQRQRLTLMTSNSSADSIRLLKEVSPGNWLPYTTTMSEVSTLFSTRIMGISPQCEPEACTAQKAAFGVGDVENKDPVSAAYNYKFLLDMDGNGFSGRFYRLLRSRSLVFKQAAFKEWHDDRVIPWVHFIPVSTSFADLPEMVKFFATTHKGQEISRQIANDSRVWAGKVLRDVDLKLVWLRMLMEYGRIMDPTRQV